MRVIDWDWDRRILGVDGLPCATKTYPGDLVTLVSCGEHRAESCAACPRVIHFNFFFNVCTMDFYVHPSSKINPLEGRNMVQAGAMETVSGKVASASQVICLKSLPCHIHQNL